jgi:hypothetical protein
LFAAAVGDAEDFARGARDLLQGFCVFEFFLVGGVAVYDGDGVVVAVAGLGEVEQEVSDAAETAPGEV